MLCPCGAEAVRWGWLATTPADTITQWYPPDGAEVAVATSGNLKGRSRDTTVSRAISQPLPDRHVDRHPFRHPARCRIDLPAFRGNPQRKSTWRHTVRQCSP